MTRRAAALLFSVLMLFSFAGCHGSKKLASFSVPGEFNTSKTFEISFWAKNDTNKKQTDIYKKAISDFQKLYPNIHVNLRLYTDYGRIYSDVITNISTNTTPNVCVTYPDHIATYLTGQDVVVPLDELMNDEKYGLGGSALLYDPPRKDEVIDKYLNECMYQGHYYAIPYMRSSEVCYVNKTYVEAMGYTLPEVLTWDYIWEVSEAATAKNSDGTFKVNGQKVMIPFIYKSTDNMMIQYLKQKNAPYSSSEGDILLFNDLTKEFLYTIKTHSGSEAFSTFKRSSYPANFLNAGQCIFAIDSTAGATWMGSGAPLSDISEENKVDFETEVMMIPQVDTEHPQMISQGPSVCIFNKTDSQEVLASWLFAQYLLTDDVQISYSQTEGYIPVTSKAQSSEAYTEYLSSTENDALHYEVKLRAAKMLLENIENTFVTPVFNGSASVRDAAGQMIENVVKSVARKENVNEEYMNKLFSDVSSLYRLDQIDAGIAQSGTQKLGKLPTMSVVLLSALAVTWFFIVLTAVTRLIKKKKD